MIILGDLRTASRLDARSARVFAWMFAGLAVLSLAVLIATARGGIDAFGHLLGSDFLSFWSAGRLLVAGGSPYDAAAHLETMKAFAADLPGYPAYWYPPLFLVLCWPFGLLAYFPALVAWMALSGAAYFAALRLWAKGLGLNAPVWLWFVAFPPVVTTITHGQTSFLVAALLGASLFLVRRRPLLAGLLLGLATFKPQFGLLIPFALLLTGNVRVGLMAVVSMSVLITIATLAFGPQVWTDWYALTTTANAAMEQGAVGYGKMVSPFAGLMLMGAPEMLAYGVQVAISLSLAALVAMASWKRDWTDWHAALVLAGAPLATPFVLDYDLVILAFPLIYLAATGYRDWEKSVSVLVFVATLVARPIALNIGVPIMPIAIALLFWVLWRRRGTAPAS